MGCLTYQIYNNPTMQQQIVRQNGQVFSYSPRKVTASKMQFHTNSQLNQSKDSKKQQTFLKRSQIIYNVHFGQDMIIIVSKKGIVIYSLLTMKIIYEKIGVFWDAKPIPYTNYLLCICSETGNFDQQKGFNILKILDMNTSEFIGTIKLKMSIEEIKASKHCLTAANSKQLAVLHFPSLKPICHEPAGNGIFNVFDISYDGLTFAYQYQKKGMLIIHNFTNTEITKTYRKYSHSDMNMTHTQKSVQGVQSSKPSKHIIQLQAHKQGITIIKITHNGSRIATASTKGTVIRVFLASNGVLFQELRVGYELHKLLDINFSEEGNVLTCLTESNMVYLYNLKLEPFQQTYQSFRRGYKIYQQRNPKSIFSFLSIFHSNFGQQHPFAHYQLLKPKQEQLPSEQKNQEESKKQQTSQISSGIESNQKPIKRSKTLALDSYTQEYQNNGEKQIAINMPVVVEEEEHDVHYEKVYLKKQKEEELSFNELTGQGQNYKKPIHLQLRQRLSSRTEEQVNQDRYPQIIEQQPKTVSQNLSSTNIEEKQFRKSSLKRSSSQISPSINRSNSIINKTKPLAFNKQAFIPTVSNTVGKVFVGGNNFIWAVKGHYIFMIKYDPFNGGQMYHRQTIQFAK